MAGFSLRMDESENEQREGIWTPYGPEPTDEEKARNIKQESFKIRPLSTKMMDHFRKMATKKVWRRNQADDELNPEQYNELLYDYLIEDWEGIYLDKKKEHPAPCELKYKMALSGLGLDRPNFIVVQGSLYANDDAAREAAEEANFRQVGPTRLGSSTAGLQPLSETL